MSINSIFTITKPFVTLIFLIYYSITFCQEATVGFTQKKQNFDFSEGQPTVEISLKNADINSSNDPIFLRISSDEDVLIGGRIIDLVFFPKTADSVKDIGIYIDPLKAKDKSSFMLQIEKRDEDAPFSISQKDHFIYYKAKQKKEVTVGIEKLDDTSLTVDVGDDINFRFHFLSNGCKFEKSDSLKLTLIIQNGLEVKHSVQETFGDKTHLIISLKKGEENYEAVKDSLLKNKSLTLRLASIEHNSNKDISETVDKKNNTVTYNLKRQNKLSNRYDIFFGSNFDLKEKFSTREFFTEINVFLPKMVKNKYGLRGGIYKNNTSTKLEEDRKQTIMFTQLESTDSTVTYETRRENSIPTVSIENLGLFVEGLYALSNSSEDFNLFLGFHVEVIQRLETYTFESTDPLTLDVNTISLTELQNNPVLIENLNRSDTYTNKYVDSYFGLSLPTFYHHKNTDGQTLEVMVNPSLGVGEPGIPLNPEMVNPLSFYGFTKFHLIFGSEKGLKFKIGGEARKYFNFDQAPIITVNFSAAVNLEELFKTGS